MAALSNIITPTNVLTATNTATVTNKTLQSPNITAGLTLTGAAGTAGQVLASGGAGVAPTWVTAASGAQDYIVQSYGIV